MAEVIGKLGYALSSTALKTKFTDWELPTSPIYRSVFFTEDGYIYTHGKLFRAAVEGETNPWGLGVTIIGKQLTVKLGEASATADLPVAGVKSTTTAVVTVSKDANNIVDVKHNVSGVTADAYGTAGTAGVSVSIPNITVDTYGHVTAASEKLITLNQVKQVADTTSTKKYLLFGSASESAITNFSDSIFVNATNGSLTATSFVENGTSLVDKYLGVAHASVKATKSVLGHVTLSDAVNTSAYADGIAATPFAVQEALRLAKEHAEALFNSNDAMMLAGVVDASTGKMVAWNEQIYPTGVSTTTLFTSLPTYRSGFTFRVSVSGNKISTFGNLEAGDVLLCSNDKGSAFAASDFTIIQNNIDGAVTAPNDLTADNLLLGNGGKTVKHLANGSAGQILKMVSKVPTWVDPTDDNSWRAIQVNGNQLLGNEVTGSALNFKNGAGIELTGADGAITIKNTDGLSGAKTLNINNVLTFNPSESNASILYQNGITAVAGTTGQVIVKHSNAQIAEKSTAGVYKITHDTFGHILSSELVSSMVNPNDFSVKVNSANEFLYNGSTKKTIDFVNGGDITFSANIASNVLTIGASVTHKYRPISYKANTGSATVNLLSNLQPDAVTLIGGINVSLSNSGNSITFDAVDSWRPVSVFQLNADGSSTKGMVLNNIVKTELTIADLDFGRDFLWVGDAETGSLQLGWTEIQADGTIKYY